MAKSKGKAKEVAPAPITEQEPMEEAEVTDTEQQEDEDDHTTALLTGFESSGDERDGDDQGLVEGQSVPKIPRKSKSKSKDKAVTKTSTEISEGPGVVYVGCVSLLLPPSPISTNIESSRVPHGFYEPQMRAYFSQFGPISRLRLSRNRTTGASKHYAFLEFESAEVASIVAATMDNYLLFGHILKCKLVPHEQVHEKLWIGANKRFKKVPWNKIEGRKLEQPKGRDHWEKRVERERSKRGENAKKLKEVMDYEFDAPVKAVADLPVRAVETITDGAVDADKDSTIVTGGGDNGAVVMSQQVTMKKVGKGKKATATEVSETSLGGGITDAVSAGIKKADAMLETAMNATNNTLIPTARAGKRKADEALETAQDTVNDAIKAATNKEAKKPKKSKESKEAKAQKADQPTSSNLPKTKSVEGSAIADETLKSREGATNDGTLPLAKKGKRKAKEALKAPPPVEDEPVDQTPDEPITPATKKPKRDKKIQDSASKPVAKGDEPAKGISKASRGFKASTAQETGPVSEKTKRTAGKTSEAPAPAKPSASKGADSDRSTAEKLGRKPKTADSTGKNDDKEKSAPASKKGGQSATKASEEALPNTSKSPVVSSKEHNKAKSGNGISTGPELAPQGHKADPPGPPLKPAQSTPLSAVTAPKRSHKGKDTVGETFENAEQHGIEEAEKDLKNASAKRVKAKEKKGDMKITQGKDAAPYDDEARKEPKNQTNKKGRSKPKNAKQVIEEVDATIGDPAPIDDQAQKATKMQANKKEQPGMKKAVKKNTEEANDTVDEPAPTDDDAEKEPDKAANKKNRRKSNKDPSRSTDALEPPTAEDSHKADPPGPALNPQQTTPASALTAPKRSHGGKDTVEETFEHAEEHGIKEAKKEMQKEAAGKKGKKAKK